MNLTIILATSRWSISYLIFSMLNSICSGRQSREIMRVNQSRWHGWSEWFVSHRLLWETCSCLPRVGEMFMSPMGDKGGSPRKSTMHYVQYQWSPARACFFDPAPHQKSSKNAFSQNFRDFSYDLITRKDITYYGCCFPEKVCSYLRVSKNPLEIVHWFGEDVHFLTSPPTTRLKS